MNMNAFTLRLPRARRQSTSQTSLWSDIKWLLSKQDSISFHVSEHELIRDLQQGRLYPQPLETEMVEK